MCFSATASFTAGAVLLGLGAVAMGSVRQPRELPFAAIPLVFSIQQVIEGLVWLGLDQGMPEWSAAMAQAFAFFALVLWPAYVPLTVWLAEPHGARRRALGWLAGGGALLAGWLLLALVAWPVTVQARAWHIEYETAPFLGVGSTALYLAATAGSLLLSSQAPIRRFGVLVLAAFLVTVVLYSVWFVSVWCFFAAAVSSTVSIQLVALRRRERLTLRLQAAASP